MATNQYSNPLAERYASTDMLHVFSQDFKFTTWRKLWIALAEGEKKLGLPVTDVQIKEMIKFKDKINYDVAQKREKETRHDVMSHVYAFGKQCPKAEAIIHLGATSAYVGDNTDLIQLREGIKLVKKRLLQAVKAMSGFATKHKNLPTLGFTHYQPAQVTTVGKRVTLWIQDLMIDLSMLEHFLDTLKFRGVKGTTGTQASFLALFNDDHSKVKKLDEYVRKYFGFPACYGVTGQTYTRKVDANALSVLSAIAQSAHKITTDIRLLANLKEMEEPFAKNQIGSSAMAYKRNPMRSERVGSLSKFVISLHTSVAMTASTQWFERTLDDSANKRISVPEAFLAIDSSLLILKNIFEGAVVYPEMIKRRIMSELPFMATENILMEAVKKGGNRQYLHEKIRVLSMKAAENVKMKGLENNLLELIAEDESFGLDLKSLKAVLSPKNYVGRSAEQVKEFLAEEVNPILRKNKKLLSEEKVELKV